MLKKIYVDNYKNCVDFSLSFGPLNLLMGTNGAGKTTVFDVLRLLQDFVRAESSLEELFDRSTLTRWKSSPVQTFGIGIGHQENLYEYKLEIEHDLEEKSVFIKSEQLVLNNETLLEYVEYDLQYRVNNESELQRTRNISFKRTTLDVIPEKSNTTAITWFRKRMERFIIVQILPQLIQAVSNDETRVLLSNAGNFASWYRHISQEHQGDVLDITHELTELFENFRSFQLREAGDARILWGVFQQNGSSVSYRFDEFSEGERVLVCLYAIMHYAKSKDYTICIDEPDNYVALPEIQPWLLELSDLCDDDHLQALLISHHPELINYLVPSRAGIWFSREDGFSPTRTKRILEPDGNGISVSELVARGWIDD